MKNTIKKNKILDNDSMSSTNEHGNLNYIKNEVDDKNSKKINQNNNFWSKIKLKPYEFALILTDLIVIISIFIFFEKNLLSFICSFVGCFAIFFLAKGFFFAPCFNVIYDILYIILSYTQNYFGEAIIYLVMTLPIDFYSVFSWRKNKNGDSEIIKINKLSKKEWGFFWVGTIILTIGFYFILKFLNTSELIISTISFVTSAMAGYFLIRRSNFYSLAYALNDLVLIILWLMSVIKISPSYLPTVINFCCSFIIDTYGFINLQIEVKKQNKIKV